LTSQERDSGLVNALIGGQKIQQKSMVGTITLKTKGKAKKGQKLCNPQAPKKGKN
jgi:hypothetical protein